MNNVANLTDIKTSYGWQLSKTDFGFGLFYEVCVCVDMKYIYIHLAKLHQQNGKKTSHRCRKAVNSNE